MVKDEEIVVEVPRDRSLRAGADDEKVVTTIVPRRKRRIVLSTGQGMWNTGVWPNWGQGTDEVTLNWAAAGTVVKKSCTVTCDITHDQSGINDADAVIMEAINHPKFLGPSGDKVPLPWPELRDNLKRKLKPAPTEIPATAPITALFYYEAAQSYPHYTLADAAFADKFDFSMTPSQDSTLPVTLVCPWGRPTSDFLTPASQLLPRKAPGRLIAYFNEHGVAQEYASFVDDLFGIAGRGIHAYQNRRNANVPAEFGACNNCHQRELLCAGVICVVCALHMAREQCHSVYATCHSLGSLCVFLHADTQPFQLANRLRLMGTYRFLLVTEAIVEADYISPEFSQAIAAGAVPVSCSVRTSEGSHCE